MGAPVVHYEITGQDGAALREFYGSLFGWNFDLQPAPRDYGLIAAATEGGMTGGVGTSAEGPGALTFYVGTDDIAGSLAKASELGGTVVMEEMEVGDGVSIGLFTDPEGHLVGVAKS